MKKQANGGGSVERRGDLWWVQVSLPRAEGEKLRRKRLPIVGSESFNRTQAKRAGSKIAADVQAGRIVFDDAPVVVRAASGSPAADWATVRKLGEAWTSGEMFKRFGRVNKLRTKAGAKIDSWVLAASAYDVRTRGASGPVFGDLRVADVTSDDVSAVMGALPAEQRAETRIKQYNRLHRLFELAEFPCRLRSEGTNPVKKYLRPEGDADKLFSFLFPSEVLALLVCSAEKIPLARRVLYALAVYTGQRKGSLLAMKWGHVDFDHGTLASFKTKTGRAQYFVADPGLMALLEGWHFAQGMPGDEQTIVSADAIGCEPKRIATTLRDDLLAAGVTRTILFETKADNVEALRFHDLRATFCTWARRAGKTDSWISERTGQEVTGEMISRYDRGAQTLDDLRYAPFPDVSDVVPSLKEARLHRRLHTRAREARKAAKDSPTVPAGYIVGAIGIEPTTPTVSSHESGLADIQSSETARSTLPLEPLATPQTERCNASATELRSRAAAALLRGDDAEAERLIGELAEALKPRLAIVR